jgi:hypothetical protein
MINWPCSKCGEPLSVKPAMAGRKWRCPSCQTIVPVPDAPTGRPSPRDFLPEAESGLRVHVVDVDLPFSSMFRLCLKWGFAAVPAAVILSLTAWATTFVLTLLKIALMG